MWTCPEVSQAAESGWLPSLTMATGGCEVPVVQVENADAAGDDLYG